MQIWIPCFTVPTCGDDLRDFPYPCRKFAAPYVKFDVSQYSPNVENKIKSFSTRYKKARSANLYAYLATLRGYPYFWGYPLDHKGVTTFGYTAKGIIRNGPLLEISSTLFYNKGMAVWTFASSRFSVHRMFSCYSQIPHKFHVYCHYRKTTKWFTGGEGTWKQILNKINV